MKKVSLTTKLKKNDEPQKKLKKKAEPQKMEELYWTAKTKNFIGPQN